MKRSRSLSGRCLPTVREPKMNSPVAPFSRRAASYRLRTSISMAWFIWVAYCRNLRRKTRPERGSGGRISHVERLEFPEVAVMGIERADGIVDIERRPHDA